MARQPDNRPITHPGNRTEPLRTALLRTGTSDTKSSDESKKELQQSIDKADKLVDKLSKDDSLTLTGRKLLSALSKAADSGQKLVESSNIKDSKYYKAAKVTLDEAIDMADNWVNSQAAKAQ